MIPESFIENWRTHVKWQTPSMIEQDLVISRALVCLYNDPIIKDALVFRGAQLSINSLSNHQHVTAKISILYKKDLNQLDQPSMQFENF